MCETGKTRPCELCRFMLKCILSTEVCGWRAALGGWGERSGERLVSNLSVLWGKGAGQLARGKYVCRVCVCVFPF